MKRGGGLKKTSTLKAKTPLKANKSLVAKAKLKKTAKKHTVAWYKAEARKYFNRMVKYRDSSLIEGEWLYLCITCPRRVLFKDREGRFYRAANAGHFMPETKSNTRFEEENVNGQCSYCNKWGFGEQIKYARALDLKYGDGTAQRLEEMSAVPKQWTIPELEKIIKDSKEQIKLYEKREAHG